MIDVLKELVSKGQMQKALFLTAVMNDREMDALYNSKWRGETVSFRGLDDGDEVHLSDRRIRRVCLDILEDSFSYSCETDIDCGMFMYEAMSTDELIEEATCCEYIRKKHFELTMEDIRKIVL